MDWSSILFVLPGLAIFAFMYMSSQKTAPVALEHQVPVPEGGLEAIEYFWRPG